MTSKRIIPALLVSVFIITLAISGCKSDNATLTETPVRQTTPKPVDVDVSYITDRIFEEAEFTGMESMPAVVIDSFYGLDTDIFEQYSFYTAVENTYADELVVLKLKDEASRDEVYEAIESRINDLEDQFREYLPEEREKVRNNIVYSSGIYTIFVIAEDSGEVLEIFRDITG